MLLLPRVPNPPPLPPLPAPPAPILTGFPTTECEIRAQLDQIENLLNTYLISPAIFFRFTGDHIGMDVSGYIQALERRRAELLLQLENLPYWKDSDVDPSGPMIQIK